MLPVQVEPYGRMGYLHSMTQNGLKRKQEVGGLNSEGAKARKATKNPNHNFASNASSRLPVFAVQNPPLTRHFNPV